MSSLPRHNPKVETWRKKSRRLPSAITRSPTHHKHRETCSIAPEAPRTSRNQFPRSMVSSRFFLKQKKSRKERERKKERKKKKQQFKRFFDQ
jgi:hypothetical protein